MKIEKYKHLCLHTISKHEEERWCWALKEDDGTFVDSFDYDEFNDKIRFYGSDKHYDVYAVPKAKQKIWNTKDFNKIMNETV